MTDVAADVGAEKSEVASEYSLTKGAEELMSAFLQYEKTIRDLIEASKKDATGRAELPKIMSDCKKQLDALNTACDSLHQATQRKCGVGITYEWLRNAEIEDENSQEFIKKAAGSLCEARSAFLDALNSDSVTEN